VTVPHGDGGNWVRRSAPNIGTEGQSPLREGRGAAARLPHLIACCAGDSVGASGDRPTMQPDLIWGNISEKLGAVDLFSQLEIVSNHVNETRLVGPPSNP
jgi:hypothetical protein